MKRAGVLAFALLLVGCQHAVQTVAVCPPVTPFTPAQQMAIAQAAGLLGDDDPLSAVLVDWERMRDAARACRP